MSLPQILLLPFALLFSAVVLSDGLEVAEAQLVAERPNPDGPPTVVGVGMTLLDIDSVDDAQQRFSVDMFALVTWQDPRLALPEEEHSGLARTISMDQIWTPRGLIVNDRGLSPQLARVAEVDDFGNVEYRQRLTGYLATDLELEEFPFDVQLLPIELVSYQYSPKEMVFSWNSDFSGREDSFSAEGWQFRMLEPQIAEYRPPGAKRSRPSLTFVIEATRKYKYYIVTMFLPMTLIVFMGWTAFWFKPDMVPPRIGISTAAIFSLMAFGFSIRANLPQISYMRRADLFVIGNTLLVFLALGVTVIGSRLASDGKMEQALRVNASARLFYVVLFIVISSAAITVN